MLVAESVRERIAKVLLDPIPLRGNLLGTIGLESTITGSGQKEVP